MYFCKTIKNNTNQKYDKIMIPNHEVAGSSPALATLIIKALHKFVRLFLLHCVNKCTNKKVKY